MKSRIKKSKYELKPSRTSKVSVFRFGVASRGITLPKYESEGLHWVVGDKLRFSIDGRRMILEKDDTV